jgi:hypothetical protein
VAAGAPAGEKMRVVYDQDATTGKRKVMEMVSAWCAENNKDDPFHRDCPYKHVKYSAIENAMEALGQIKPQNDRRGKWRVKVEKE